MSGFVYEAGNPINLTATAVVQAAGGALLGFYVNSTSSGTIVLRNDGASGNAISGTITPAVGWHSFPASFGANLHATIGGTLNVTFFVVPG